MTAVLGVSASSAAASDVWMWACHGPNGAALGALPFTENESLGGQVEDLGGGCGAESRDAGKRLAAPTAGSSAEWVLSVGGSFNVSKVRVIQRATGLDAAGAPAYTLTWNGTRLSDDPSGTEPEYDVSPRSDDGASELKIKLECGQGCTPGAATLDVLRIGFLLNDTTGPYSAGVNRNNPVIVSPDPTYEGVGDGVPMVLAAKDDAAGLEKAVVEIFAADGQTRVLHNEIEYGCTDLSPGVDSIDRPLDRSKCPLEVSTAVKPAWLSLYRQDWLLPQTNGHTRTVSFYDAGGHAPAVPVKDEPFEVIYIGKPISSRTLSIGTSGIVVPEPGGPSTPGGGVAGTQRSSCRTPRLSVVLDSKPLRVRRGVPTLKYRKAYRFEGRLTCVINGRRRSAPKRTRLEILHQVGKRTVRKPNTLIRSQGAVNVRLAFVSSRTVIFRYTNADGQRSQVRIRVRVAKK